MISGNYEQREVIADFANWNKCILLLLFYLFNLQKVKVIFQIVKSYDPIFIK